MLTFLKKDSLTIKNRNNDNQRDLTTKSDTGQH